ncbi:MAG: hypothetical protein MJ252_03905, partial [archaeon]|nr:hypothetical protein [archaeon]
MSHFYIEPFSLYDQIRTKRKIRNLDVHKTLPWIVFNDKENNIIIYDVAAKRPIRAFTVQQYFVDSINIKSLKFFDTNDRKYITHYEINDTVRIKGIPLNLRSSLIIITIEKYVCFYSYMLQNFIRIISNKDLGDVNIIRCELFNYLYVIILTEDGVLNIWNLKDWNLVRVIPKTSFGNKSCVYFSIISLATEEKLIVCANKNGNLFLIDINKKEIETTKIDPDKCEHEHPVFMIDYNPRTNVLMTLSKSQILLIDLGTKGYKKIPNFEYCKKQKIKGCTINISNLFNQKCYFIYGKTNFLVLLQFELDDQKVLKLDTKSVKTASRYLFDLNSCIVQKVNDKPTRINNAVFLLNTTDYLILATNKGVFILKGDSSHKPAILPSEALIEMNQVDKSLYFYTISANALYLNTYNKAAANSNKTYEKNASNAISSIFSSAKLNSLKDSFHRYKLKFSFDYSYMSCLDYCFGIFAIFKVDTLKDSHNFTEIFSGNALDLVWCPYDNIFAISVKRQINFKEPPVLEIKKEKTGMILPGINRPLDSFFNLTVYKFDEGSNHPNTLYESSELFCHRIFGGPLLGVFKSKPENSGDNFTMNIQTPYTYGISNKMEVNFYHWNEKKSEKITVSEEPMEIYYSNDLDYFIITFSEKYAIYKLNSQTGSIDLQDILYYSVINGFIYENFVFVFLMNEGIYFQILSEKNGYPFKLFNFSNEMNDYHLRLSKELKEKESLYYKKQFQSKMIGIYNNYLVTSNVFGQLEIKECDHILLKIIYAVKNKNFNELHQLLLIVEKKFIKSILAIFDFYFENDEQILRKIFDQNLIEHFELYKYLKCFMRDLAASKNENSFNEIERMMKHNLIVALRERNDISIRKIQKICENQKLGCELIASRCISKDNLLKTLITKERYFESVTFNNCYNMNKDMNERLKTKAFEIINSG